jgi:hypothetical protein
VQVVEILLTAHTCFGREKLARITRTLLVSCMLYAVGKLVELLEVTQHRQMQGEVQKKDHGEIEESKGMLMSCSPRPAMTVELSLCVRPYMVYARREQVSE